MKKLVSIILLSLCSVSTFASSDVEIRFSLYDKLSSVEFTCEQTNSKEQEFELELSTLEQVLIKNTNYIVEVDEEVQPAIKVESKYAKHYIYEIEVNTIDAHREISSFKLTIKKNLGEGQVNIGSLIRPEMIFRTKTSMYSSHTCTVHYEDSETIEP